MTTAWIIARREVLALFCSAIAYVVLVVFLALCGFFFSFFHFGPGLDVSLRLLLERLIPILLVFVMPILTMRLMSEEFRSGTIETLMTAPVSDAAVIAGKFLGVFSFYLIMLAATAPCIVALALHGNPDYGAMACGYLGVALLGALYLAVGLLFSTCTSSQIVAVLCSFTVLATLRFLVPLAVVGIRQLRGVPRAIVQHLSTDYHLVEFTQGAINLNHVTFFVTSTGLLLFLAVKVLESRRWR